MKKIIVANWKMYMTLSQSVALAKKFTVVSSQFTDAQIVLCPSFVALEEVAKILRPVRARGRLWRPTSNGISLGAQDVEPERRGAYTGEVGIDDLTSLQVEYVLVGHSERRQHPGETDAMVNKKLRAVLKAGMRPILCVGEPRSVREKGMVKVRGYVGMQVRRGLKDVSPRDLKCVVVAYEPIWAISGRGGHEDTPEDTAKMHRYIRKVLGVKNMTILYGGSVNKNNAAGFLNVPEVDGLLIGKASTDISQLRSIIKLL